jgi:GMP synthase (glutamine-hydrolysing)
MTTRPLRFLVAESEPPEARERRRASVGRTSGETYMDTLRAIAPGALCDLVRLAEETADVPAGGALEGYDGVFLTGSPLHVYEDTPEVRRQLDFMRAVFASGTPAFGSCAGLQVAAVAAGGMVRENRRGHEVGIARRITPTEAGRAHGLLAGRPAAFDALSIHSDEVERLPDGAVLLASNGATAIQAAEIRHAGGIFWGVQYHPELPLEEIAAAVRRQAEDVIEQGLARDVADVATQAGLIEALGREPGRRDLLWRLGVDDEVADAGRRQTELRNAVEHLVKPTASGRGRG